LNGLHVDARVQQLVCGLGSGSWRRAERR
jgi:hypothetical protein